MTNPAAEGRTPESNRVAEFADAAARAQARRAQEAASAAAPRTVSPEQLRTQVLANTLQVLQEQLLLGINPQEGGKKLSSVERQQLVSEIIAVSNAMGTVQEDIRQNRALEFNIAAAMQGAQPVRKNPVGFTPNEESAAARDSQKGAPTGMYL